MKLLAPKGTITRAILMSCGFNALAYVGWQRYHRLYQDQLDLIARDLSCQHGWNLRTGTLVCTPDMQAVWLNTIITLYVTVLAMILVTAAVAAFVIALKGPSPCDTADCPCADHHRLKTINTTVLTMVLFFGVVVTVLSVAAVSVPSLIPAR